MATTCTSPETSTPKMNAETKNSTPAVATPVSVLTGGFDRPYAFGLTTSLAAKGIRLEVVGSDEVDSPEMHNTPGLNFLNLQKNSRGSNRIAKILRVLSFYVRQCWYLTFAKSKIFHILWNNKPWFSDRVVLMLYYKVLGKKIVLTVHNVNAEKRDGIDSWWNRLTLKIQYKLVDHLFVHTEKMKQELLDQFGISSKVTVIPFGINNSIPEVGLTSAEAKKQLGLAKSDKTILFFGAIRPYKGLEYLAEAFKKLAGDPNYKLIIAGEPKKDCAEYIQKIQQGLQDEVSRKQVIEQIRHVGDDEIELYFKAADVLALSYTTVFQSGVLFLAYSFGLPVVASDVGAVREDVIEGETGFLCKPCDENDLSRVLNQYFQSDLFKNLDEKRQDIRAYVEEGHSWTTVAEITNNVYAELLRN